jgi:hypothetical protein
VDTPATQIGIVFNKVSDKVVRIFVPDFQEQLANYALDPNEVLQVVDRATYKLSSDPINLTTAQVAAIISSVQPVVI